MSTISANRTIFYSRRRSRPFGDFVFMTQAPVDSFAVLAPLLDQGAFQAHVRDLMDCIQSLADLGLAPNDVKGIG